LPGALLSLRKRGKMTRDPETPSGAKPLKSPDPRDAEKPEGGLLSRWSARKTAVAQSETATAEARIEAKRLEDERPEIEARQAANREIAEAIDIDVADYETDFTPFLKDGVPAALRRRALKAMWRTNPILANVDGLNDYDEDFRAVEAGFEVVKSTWEVGRGYAAKAKEVSREMADRDEEINKTEAARREAAEASPGDLRNKNDNAEAAPEDKGDEEILEGDDLAAATADEVTEIENDPSLAKAPPVSPRATLRQRLLQDPN